MLVVSPAGAAAHLCSGPLQAGVLLKHRRLQLVGLCLGMANLLHGRSQRRQPYVFPGVRSQRLQLHVFPCMRSQPARTSCRRLFSSESR